MGITKNLLLVLALSLFFCIPHIYGSGEDEFTMLSALGRPFALGMLYDCRNDQITPGVSLWNSNTIENATVTSTKPFTSIKMSSSDTLKKKADLLGVSARLSVTVYGGTVTVSGAASYLKDTNTISNTVGMGFVYKSTSEFRSFSSDIFYNLEHKLQARNDYATHVVVGILYGNEAVFEFSKSYTDETDYEKIWGQVSVMVNKFPDVNITGSASLSLTNNETDIANEIDVNYYGDFIAGSNPSTYMEALDLYGSLTSYITSSVPLTVWLYPLSRFDSSAAALENEITEDIADQFLEILTELDKAVAMGDSFITQLNGRFPNLYEDITDLQNYINSYKSVFQTEMTTLYTEFRSNADKSLNDLSVLISKHEASAFGNTKLDEIINGLEVMTTFLVAFINGSSDLMITRNKLISIMIENDYDMAIFCEINTYFAQPWLKNMANYLKDDTQTLPSYTIEINEAIEKILKQKSSFLRLLDLNSINSNNDNFKVVVYETQIADATVGIKFQNLAVSASNAAFTDYTIPSEPGKPGQSGSRICWTEANPSTLEYQLYYMLTTESNPRWLSRSISIKSQSFCFDTAQSLSGDKYKFKVAAQYGKFIGPYSDESDIFVIN